MNENKLITQARTWIGTRFHHQGRLKCSDFHEGGCDCIGLIIGVLSELKIKFNNLPIESLDSVNYRRLVNNFSLLNNVQRNLIEKPKDQILPGDIALFAFNQFPQHIGIISEYSGQLSLIHAYLKNGFVVEHLLDEYWQEKLYAVFYLPK